MHVADILKRKGTQVVTVNAADLIIAAADKMNANRIGALVVLDEDAHVAGIISERDVVRGLAEYGAEILARKVESLMSTRLHVCRPSDDIKDVMARMTNYRIRHLPVIEGDTLHGLISIGDVVKYRLDEVQTEAKVLRDIVITHR
ncbi:MAG TPA: CBS domain-containing protein [Rhodothermales bacterium]|nr:CBS domain-containing protein [Rhodothermales bacterium]